MSRRRILLFCLPGTYSGVVRYVEALAKHFSRDNEVAIVTTSLAGIFGELQKSHPEVRFYVCEGIRNSFSPSNFVACLRMIRKYVAEFQPDIIQLNGSLFGLAGRLVPTPGRAKFFTYHGLPFGNGRGFAKSAFFLGLEVLAANWSRCHHIFISKRDMRLMGHFILGKRRLHYIPNGISLSEDGGTLAAEGGATGTKGQINLVVVANYKPQKRLDRMIGAFAHLDDGFTLTIVGNDSDGPELAAIADEKLGAGQRRRLRLMGRRRDVRSFLEQADIFVLSSDYEGMPLSAIEALSLGLFVVMPDVGGAEEICTEGAGLVYAPNTEEGLAAALVEAADRIRRPDWSHECPRAHYEGNFAPKLMLSRMEDLYDAATAKSSKRERRSA